MDNTAKAAYEPSADRRFERAKLELAGVLGSKASDDTARTLTIGEATIIGNRARLALSILDGTSTYDEASVTLTTTRHKD